MTKSTVVVDVITKSGKKSNGTYARLNNSNKNVTVVVMGDEGVGKTSLISTYISRHFVEEGLPGCMTRFTLPPDTTTYMPYLVLGGEEEEEKGAASQKGFVCSLVDTQGAAPTLLPKRGNTADMCSSDICDANATTKNNSSSSSSSLTSPNSSLSSPTAATNTIADDASVSVTQSIRNSIPTAQTKIQRDTTDVNVIVLVYDLVRSESFTRLEQHWLPLIETCFDGEVSNNVIPAYVGIPNCPLISLSAEITYSNWGQISIPVIIAGNKFDLWLDEHPQEQQQQHQQEVLHQHHPTDRQKIVSLLQRYPFVRQCIKCSAKTLFHVTDIFQKAQHAVLFPIQPIYDVQHDALTIEAQRAFCRIFRMADLDHDGYLSNAELLAFQTKCYRVWGPLFDETVSGWNKILSKKILSSTSNSSSTSKRNPKYFYCYHKNQQEDSQGTGNSPSTPIVQNDKFTMEGFFSIFEVFMSKDRMEIPWQILRLHGYDDNLHLHIPPFLLQSTKNHESASFPLSAGAISFLTSLFELYDTDEDGILTESGILSIFAILPINEELPPWHPSRSHTVFKDAFSLPKLQQQPHCYRSIINHNNNKNNTGILSLLDGDSSFTADGITIATNSCNEKNDFYEKNSDGSDIPLSSVASGNTQLDDVMVEQHSTSLSSSADEKKRYRWPIHPPFSLLDWINHWIMCACISPTMTKVELYQLGYVEGRSDHVKKSFRRLSNKQKPLKSSKYSTRSTIKDHQIIRVRVFGKDSIGKAKLMNSLSQIEHYSDCQSMVVDHHQGDKVDEEVNVSIPLTSCTYILTSTSNSIASLSNNDGVAHFVFTEIPEKIIMEIQDNDDNSEREEIFQRNIDLVMLVFDCADHSSLTYLLDLEKHLDSSKPRVFVGIRYDGSTSSEKRRESRSSVDLDGTSNSDEIFVESNVLSMAKLHCSNDGCEHLLVIAVNGLQTKIRIADSTPSMWCGASKRNLKMALLSSITPDKQFVLQWLYQKTISLRSRKQGNLKSIPFQVRRRDKTEKRVKIMWMGCGFFVLTGILWWRANSKSTNSRNREKIIEWKWWRKNWFH